jgi:hypothetical protein
MENHVENVQTFENSEESFKENTKINLPDYGPLNNFDLLVQKKISARVYKNMKKDLPKLINEGLTFEQLHELVLDYNLPHSLLFDFKRISESNSQNSFATRLQLFLKNLFR